MSGTEKHRDDWQQFADDLGTCASSFVRMLAPDRESLRVLRTHFLRAQAEMLRGVLTVVESRLAADETPSKSRSKKIKVE
jgi:hypothetical protein